MKAQFVYESVNFERGRDPKEAMSIGLGPDIFTSVEMNELIISPQNNTAHIYFDPEGWDNYKSAISQIRAFAKGTHDLIDPEKIDEALAEYGYTIAEGKWIADEFEISIPIEPLY